MFVKICGLSSRAHVDAAVAAGADAIGFVFADSVRRVEPALAAEISSNLPTPLRKVAVMLHPSNDEWQTVLNDFIPDVLQTDAEDFESLDIPESIECWPVYRESNRGTVPGNRGTVPYIYEGKASGVGETVDWERAAEVARRGNMILAGGISAANVAEAVAIVRPFGVDVSSAVESSRGQKDSNLIREFISAARAAEKNL